jgi:hypothetical protein
VASILIFLYSCGSGCRCVKKHSAENSVLLEYSKNWQKDGHVLSDISSIPEEYVEHITSQILCVWYLYLY